MMTSITETSPQTLAPEPSRLKLLRSIILGRPGTIAAVVVIALLDLWTDSSVWCGFR
jgi:hypothetical protein